MCGGSSNLYSFPLSHGSLLKHEGRARAKLEFYAYAHFHQYCIIRRRTIGRLVNKVNWGITGSETKTVKETNVWSRKWSTCPTNRINVHCLYVFGEMAYSVHKCLQRQHGKKLSTAFARRSTKVYISSLDGETDNTSVIYMDYVSMSL